MAYEDKCSEGKCLKGKAKREQKQEIKTAAEIPLNSQSYLVPDQPMKLIKIGSVQNPMVTSTYQFIGRYARLIVHPLLL